MDKSEKKISQIISVNPHCMTYAEISGNDRKKALELLEKLKQKEKEKEENKLNNKNK